MYKKHLDVVDEEFIQIKYEKNYSVEEEIEKIKVILFEKPLTLDEVFSRRQKIKYTLSIFSLQFWIYIRKEK